jgi:hypothetical protein
VFTNSVIVHSQTRPTLQNRANRAKSSIKECRDCPGEDTHLRSRTCQVTYAEVLLPMATNDPPSNAPPGKAPREEEYEKIVQRVSKDELHDQIARQGLEILDRGIPYVIQAARWRRIDVARRNARESPLETEPVGLIMNPFELAVANEERRRLVDALATFPDADVLAIWRHVEGIPDHEIAVAIEALGLARISPAGVRMRRMRALGKLRQLLERP